MNGVGVALDDQAFRFAVGRKVAGGELAEAAVDAIGDVVRLVFHSLTDAFFNLAGNLRVVLGEFLGGDSRSHGRRDTFDER